MTDYSFTDVLLIFSSHTGCRWTCKQMIKVCWELVGGQEMDKKKEQVGLRLHRVNIYLEFTQFLSFVSLDSVAS